MSKCAVCFILSIHKVNKHHCKDLYCLFCSNSFTKITPCWLFSNQIFYCTWEKVNANLRHKKRVKIFLVYCDYGLWKEIAREWSTLFGKRVKKSRGEGRKGCQQSVFSLIGACIRTGCTAGAVERRPQMFVYGLSAFPFALLAMFSPFPQTKSLHVHRLWNT